MRTFVGNVIRESLQTEAPLAAWTPFVERAVDMPGDPDAKVWHTCWYRVDETVLRSNLPALAAAMRPQWYAHFWEGDDLCVVLAGQFFWAKASDGSTWRSFIEYGDGVGIDRKWTESVPTTLPAWVQAALEGKV